MRILIVDDDTAIIDVIKDSVNWEKLGITQVETAYNAKSAKKILKQRAADIVISDIEMPGESGLDLLKWFQDEKIPGKFLLLTAHENFQYATQAVRYHAEEYLMKPFNVDVVEMALQKIACELRKEQIQQKSAYEEWGERNKREAKLAFWFSLFSGRISHSKEAIQRELERVNLFEDLTHSYRLVISRVTNMEEDIELYVPVLVVFMLGNIHSELLCGNPESENMIHFEHHDHGTFVAVCDADDERIKQRCKNLIKRTGKLLECTLTCCISNPCTIEEFYDVFHKTQKLLSKNIIYYGEAFFADQIVDTEQQWQLNLKLSQMEGYLEARDKKAFLDSLKKELNVKIQLKVLNRKVLQGISREIQQAVYAYMAKRGIQVSLLFSDETSVQITEKANQSVTDMLRWVNYLLDCVFTYEEEMKKSQTIIDKINQYIQEHYKEELGRNEIGAFFYLAPEYLAKMYKKKTGKNIKDYINEYRLEQAKELLNDSRVRVSDVAAEVGYSNFSYFSTLFKKYTGLTPNEYRQKWETKNNE